METTDERMRTMVNKPDECLICGDEHAESLHGEPLVMRDQSSRTVTESVGVYVVDAMTLCQDAGDDESFQRLASLYDEWNAHTDDERDEFTCEYLDDIDGILSDAGFIAVTDGDTGTWCVYRPATESVAR